LTEKISGKSGVNSKRVSKKAEDFFVTDGKNLNVKDNSETTESEAGNPITRNKQSIEYGIDVNFQGLGENAVYINQAIINNLASNRRAS
jgi:hypothetical protein